MFAFADSDYMSLTRTQMAEGEITKFICANNGSVNVDELVVNISLENSSENVRDIIRNREKFSKAVLNGQQKVIAKTSLRICKNPNCVGWECPHLHLCKKFLVGECPFAQGRRPCKFGHEVNSSQNASVLRGQGLADLTMNELRTLLLQNDQSLLPAICFDYNNDRCQKGENCTRLHICERYLKTACNCPKAHDFYEPHPLKTLQGRGVTNHMLSSMKFVYMNKQTLNFEERQNSNHSEQQQPQRRAGSVDDILDDLLGAAAGAMGIAPTNDVPGQRGKQNNRQRVVPKKNSESMKDTTEICMYFIKGHCIHTDKCFKAHSKLPYRWEVRDGRQWVALPNNEEIEKDYCDPKKTYDSSTQPVCFDTMTCGPNSARRLSTVSSVLQPTFVFTTEWAWYWEDEFGTWNLYASATGGAHSTAAISSADLEQKFQSDDKAEVEFTAGSQTYTLSFQDMIQTNKRYGTQRLVRRRPVFVSSAEAQVIKTSRRPARNQSNFTALPAHWDKSQTPETGYKRVALTTASVEYKEIEGLFRNTLTGVDIHQIERIQNKALWEVFQWQKDLMKKNNGGQNVAERKLFHGTDSKHTDTICLNNFDWRICGTHGTAYGKGSYFARDAKYSHNYTGESTVKFMFVSRVLVGDYTAGCSQYVRPPSKDGGDTIFYDSCVDNGSNPSIFVVFEKHQIYPEYLIKYEMKTTSYSLLYNTAPAATSNTAAAASVQLISPAPKPAPVQRPAPALVASYDALQQLISPAVRPAPATAPAPAATSNTAAASVHYSTPAPKPEPAPRPAPVQRPAPASVASYDAYVQQFISPALRPAPATAPAATSNTAAASVHYTTPAPKPAPAPRPAPAPAPARPAATYNTASAPAPAPAASYNTAYYQYSKPVIFEPAAAPRPAPSPFPAVRSSYSPPSQKPKKKSPDCVIC